MNAKMFTLFYLTLIVLGLAYILQRMNIDLLALSIQTLQGVIGA